MTLSTDSIVHQNSGGVATSNTSTPITVSLVGEDTTAADSVLLVFFFGEGLTITTPSGWAEDEHGSGLITLYRGPIEGLAAGESSWNFTPSATAGKAVVWVVLELTNVDPDAIVNAATGLPGLDTSGPNATATTALPNTTYDGLAFAVFCSRDSGSTTIRTWSGYTNEFAEIIDVGQAGTGNSVDIAIAALSTSEIKAYSTDATCSATFDVTNPAIHYMLVVDALGAQHRPDIVLTDGAEHGTETGNILGLANRRPWNNVTGSPTVSSSAARSGGYGWLLSTTSAACNVTGPNLNVSLVSAVAVFRRCFRLPSLSPDRELWRIQTASSQCVVTIRLVGGLLGAVFSGTSGTPSSEQFSDQSVTANQWFAVEIRFNSRRQPDYSASWAVDYNAELTDTTPAVIQTDITLTGGAAAATTFAERFGWAASITASMHTDDMVASPGTNWPIGDARVLPLKVDPAGTITVTTSTNFGVMTNNGSVAAWNATNARNAIDDVPPDLTGTRDGLVALITSTTDHAKIPMETRDLAANKENVRGAKFIGSIWAASATTSTCRVAVWDGTTAHTIFPEADPGADNVSPPVWIMGNVRASSDPVAWSQAVVDALEVWFGSNDANPDIGIDSALIELAVVKAAPEYLFGDSGSGEAYAEAHRDPASQGLIGFTVTIPSGKSITVDYEVDGSPSSTGLLTDADSPHYEAIPGGGESLPTVNMVTAY